MPAEPERDVVHRVIYEELCHGVVRESSRTAYLAIIRSLREQSAQAIILGCTEIGMLIKPQDVSVPMFDTTLIHAERAVEVALGIGSALPETRMA